MRGPSTWSCTARYRQSHRYHTCKISILTLLITAFPIGLGPPSREHLRIPGAQASNTAPRAEAEAKEAKATFLPVHVTRPWLRISKRYVMEMKVDVQLDEASGVPRKPMAQICSATLSKIWLLRLPLCALGCSVLGFWRGGLKGV